MFDGKVYAGRRAELRRRIGLKEGILLFLGNGEAPANYVGNDYRFRQDSTFLYYFGLSKPDMAAVMDLESGEDIIFGDDVDIDDIIWMGPQPLVSEMAASVGVTKTSSCSGLEEFVGKAVKAGRKVHFLPPYRNRNKILLNRLAGVPFDKMKSGASEAFIKAVVSMRLIKTAEEIAEMDLAANVGYMMHYTALKMIKAGVTEKSLVGVMEGIAVGEGYMPSFPIILSQRGETLHNHNHSLTLKNGELLLIDAGAEIESNYVSDFTRTFPVSGKFSPRQKDVYEIVCAANNLAASEARPGVTYLSVHLDVCRLLVDGLKGIGLMKGDTDEAVAAGAHFLFMPHGLGHNIGLDVHDMEDLGENYVGYDEQHPRSTVLGQSGLRMGKVLEVGHVVSDEPGIYFIPALIDKWRTERTNEQFICFDKLESWYDFGGVRLEDDLLITPDGCRLLGAKRLPISVADVEREMSE